MVIFGHNSSYPPRRRAGYILIVTINYLGEENRVPVLAAMKPSRGEGAISLSSILHVPSGRSFPLRLQHGAYWAIFESGRLPDL